MHLLLTIILLMFSGGENIIIKEQWMRPGAEKMTTALYFTIENNGNVPDTLYSVSTDICKMVQIHETYSSGELMGMREIGQIIIEPGGVEKLEPGGMHIMVMRLKQDIKAGDEVEFILSFKVAGDIIISVKALN